jgi:hypothetical protein
MKSRHHLEAILIVSALPPDGARNSRGLKKSIEKHFVLILFHPSTAVRTIWWWRWNYYDGF